MHSSTTLCNLELNIFISKISGMALILMDFTQKQSKVATKVTLTSHQPHIIIYWSGM